MFSLVRFSLVPYCSVVRKFPLTYKNMSETLTPRQMKLRTRLVSVAVSAIEREQIRRAAYLRGETVSAFIRTHAVDAAQRVAAEQDVPLIAKAA
jgi:predicted nuclease with RNAse H fold